MNRPPPAPRRPASRSNPEPNLESARQELGPVVNVIISMISVSKRRCMTFMEMSEKIAASLVNLQMDCQRLSTYIRHDPAGLNRLGIWLNAAKNALERDKEHLDEQIQIELFLQGELERWLNGEPPTEFAPPPPGMVRRQTPPQQSPMPRYLPSQAQAPHYPVPQPQARAPQHTAPPLQHTAPPLQHTAPPQRAPAPRQALPQSNESLLSPAAAFAAYQPRPHSTQAATVARESLPIVRFPVQHYAPAGQSEENAASENGASHAHVESADDDSKDKSQAAPS